MAIISNTYEQVYNIQEDDTIASRVAMVVCVLLQRGLMIAGFSGERELLTIHFKGYNKNKPVWDIDFFEQLFAHEQLLAVRENVKGIFIGSHKNLIVPHELYETDVAEGWLKHLYFVEHNDTIASYELTNDNAKYLVAAPTAIFELVKINFAKAATLPLPIYQFTGDKAEGLHLYCCITGTEVYATLHNTGQLLWHQVFTYVKAEDIAYRIKLFCKENNIEDTALNIVCNTCTAAEYDVINGLSQYFPAVTAGGSDPANVRWAATISLAQQLLACV